MSNCPETKIIGCSCVVVIFTTQRGWQLQENQVTDYCGIKLIGISSQLSEGVFSWPLKPRFSTQTQFHRIIRALLAIWASALCMRASMHEGLTFLSRWCVLFWLISAPLMVIMPSDFLNMCAQPNVRMTGRCGAAWAPLQLHPWALFWSPRQSFSSATS